MTVRRQDLWAALGLVVLVYAAVAAPILTGALGQKSIDHRLYHLPLVRAWAATWPRVDVTDYHSATGPLYHWLMAGVAQVTGPGAEPELATGLQLANAAFGAMLAVVAFAFARRFLPTPMAFLGAATLAASPYVLGNSIWLMTDNLALALIACSVGLAAFGVPTARSTLGQGVAAACAVATRQISVWLVAPIAVGWLVRARRTPRSLVALAGAIALPCATLLAFVLLWKGLVPPQFRAFHTGGGLQLGTVGYALTIVGAYGALIALAAEDGVRWLSQRPRVVALAAATGCALALLGPTNVSLEAGRNGGWVWRTADLLPVLLDRSLFIVLGSGLGTVVLLALVVDARAKARMGEALVLLTAFLGYVAAHAANAQVFQRYFDPIVLLTLVWMASLAGPTRGRLVTFALVASGQAAFAWLALARSMASGG